MKLKISAIAIILNLAAIAIPHIPQKHNLIEFLNPEKTSQLKLHLGCGQGHLPGYINIDFPPSEHTVQTTSGADLFGDITQLAYPSQSIAEFRSHHVFEHFHRQKALALLAIWHHALQLNGILVIETPDFEESIRLLLQPQYSYLQKQGIMRHIFGSHEAFWAMHYDGWYESKFRHILSALGFEVIRAEKSAYLLTRNITITAVKKNHFSTHEIQQKSHQLLKEHMICTAPDEEKMWQVWCAEFDKCFFPYVTE